MAIIDRNSLNSIVPFSSCVLKKLPHQNKESYIEWVLQFSYRYCEECTLDVILHVVSLSHNAPRVFQLNVVSMSKLKNPVIKRLVNQRARQLWPAPGPPPPPCA